MQEMGNGGERGERGGRFPYFRVPVSVQNFLFFLAVSLRPPRLCVEWRSSPPPRFTPQRHRLCAQYTLAVNQMTLVSHPARTVKRDTFAYICRSARTLGNEGVPLHCTIIWRLRHCLTASTDPRRSISSAKIRVLLSARMMHGASSTAPLSPSIPRSYSFSLSALQYPRPSAER